MPRYKVDIHGLKRTKNQLGGRTARNIKRQVDQDLYEGIYQMAEESYTMAPVETGALRSSILASVTKLSRHHYMYGSHLPYAQRQEYEHRLLRGYFRNAVRSEAPEVRDKIAMTVRRHLNI